MKDAFEKLFRAVHQFKKLNVSDLIPGLSSSEFSVMGAILQMGENGKITSSELAAKTKTLPPAVSRTLRGLEEKGYVERSVDKKDRRNTYISLTEKGWKGTGQNAGFWLLCDVTVKGRGCRSAGCLSGSYL